MRDPNILTVHVKNSNLFLTMSKVTSVVSNVSFFYVLYKQVRLRISSFSRWATSGWVNSQSCSRSVPCVQIQLGRLFPNAPSPPATLVHLITQYIQNQTNNFLIFRLFNNCLFCVAHYACVFRYGGVLRQQTLWHVWATHLRQMHRTSIFKKRTSNYFTFSWAYKIIFECVNSMFVFARLKSKRESSPSKQMIISTSRKEKCSRMNYSTIRISTWGWTRREKIKLLISTSRMERTLQNKMNIYTPETIQNVLNLCMFLCDVISFVFRFLFSVM